MTITCPSCGFSRAVAEDRLRGKSVVVVCPNCDCRFRFSAQTGAGEILPPKSTLPSGASDPQEEEIRQTASDAYRREAERFTREGGGEQYSGLPWDIAPDGVGWIAAFFKTTRLVMFSPAAFFAALAPEQKMGRALGFFLIICAIQILAESIWSGYLLNSVVSSDIGDPKLQKFSAEMLASRNNLFITLLMRSGLLIIQLYIFSFMMYLVYRLFARQRTAYSLVFQIMSYSAAPAILSLVPVFGSIAGSIWSVWCLLVGCKSAIGLNWAQTILGFLPVLFVIVPILTQAMAIVQGGL